MSSLLDDPRLDWSLLNRYQFDRARFTTTLDALRAGHLTEQAALIRAPIEPAPNVVDVDHRRADLAELGETALRSGEVAQVVLNGGMATRFGNVVKGIVEVFDGLSFIALKAEDVLKARRTYGRPVPLVLMNSFSTDPGTQAHVEAHGGFGLPAEDLLVFHQSIAMRLTPDVELFVGPDGKPSYYAPGHGDFFRCIRQSGVLGALRDRGVKTILFSNVDNLGATVDPVVIGQHLALGVDMSAEVTAKQRTASGDWDKGGAPAVVGGELQLVEGFRLPPDLPPTFLPDFSTNNFLFRAEALDQDVPLAWHVVRKKVEDRPALQLESIACEASAVRRADGTPALSLGLLRVPREGPHGRFFPIKERVDLETSREKLKARLRG